MSLQPMAGVLLTGPSFGTPVDTDLSGGFRSPPGPQEPLN